MMGYCCVFKLWRASTASIIYSEMTRFTGISKKGIEYCAMKSRVMDNGRSSIHTEGPSTGVINDTCPDWIATTDCIDYFDLSKLA